MKKSSSQPPSLCWQALKQAKIITGLENDGVAHVALISRNNDKLADELLAEQDKTLQEIYFPETLIEERSWTIMRKNS